MTALKWERKEMSKSRIVYLVKSVFKHEIETLRLSKFERIFHEQMYSAINVEGSSADKRNNSRWKFRSTWRDKKNADNNG